MLKLADAFEHEVTILHSRWSFMEFDQIINAGDAKKMIFVCIIQRVMFHGQNAEKGLSEL